MDTDHTSRLNVNSGNSQGGVGFVCIKNRKAQLILRWFMLAASFISVIFSVVPLGSCKIFSVKDSDDNRYTLGYFAEYVDGASGGCFPYSKEFVESELGPGDSLFETGKAFAIITLLVATTTFVIMLATVLIAHRHRRGLWITIRVLATAAVATQCVTSSVFGSDICTGLDTDCTLASAGVIQVVNVFILVFVSVFLFLVPMPHHPLFRKWKDRKPSKEYLPTRISRKTPAPAKMAEIDEQEEKSDPGPSNDGGKLIKETTEVSEDGATRKTKHFKLPDGSMRIEVSETVVN